MPKRTNQFQDLVALIQRSLVPTGAIVVESAEVPVDGVMREIDVLVTADIGISKFKIAVEAKDHKRKLSQTDIEALIGKYYKAGGIPINQVILVARNGFYGPAQRRAKLMGIKLYTLAEASKTDWAAELGQSARTPANFRTAPQMAGVDIEPTPPESLADHISEAVVICESCGRQTVKLNEFCAHILARHLPQQITEQIQAGFDKAFKNGVQGTICMKVFCDVKNKHLLCEGNKLPLDRATIHIHAQNEQAGLEFKYYDYCGDDGESHQIHHGKACFGNSTFEILMPDGSKSKNITVKISGDC